MNVTLKSVCGLLRQGDVDLQLSAIRVLGAIHSREPGVHKALGELLVSTENPAVFNTILEAIEANPHEQLLKYLLDILDRDDENHEPILNAIAKIGGKAVTQLKRQFDRVSTPTKLRMVTALPRIRTTQAHSFLVECCFSEDHELVRQAVHALREDIQAYGVKEKADLYQRLIQALKDKRLASNEAALSAVIIAIGILADARSKDKLLPFIDKSYPTQIRRHALMSLARLEYVGDKHARLIKALMPILAETDYEGLVRHAVAVLMQIKPRRADNGEIQKLLESKHSGVQEYAVHALGHLDSITNAELVLDCMDSKDLKIRDAASKALGNMPSAVIVILRHLDEVTDRSRAFEMVRILESHGNRIKPDKARSMIKHMLELYVSGDDHYQLYRTALLHLRPDVLQKELTSLAGRAWKKKDFAKVRDDLRLLDHTQLMTPEIRYQLAIAKLKTSKKDCSRTFRQSDYCLEHFSHLLHEDLKGFTKKLLADKVLEAEDYLYVGFHFSERINKERRFGVDMLSRVVKKWPRSNAAKVARNKLKVEGH